MQKNNYEKIIKNKAKGKKLFAVLIDPDKFESTEVISKANRAGVDFIMVGGSILSNGSFEKCIQSIKKNTSIPVLIFPGNAVWNISEWTGFICGAVHPTNLELLKFKHQLKMELFMLLVLILLRLQA